MLRFKMGKSRTLTRIAPLVLALFLLMATLTADSAPSPAQAAAPVPSLIWINLYGMTSLLDDKPLPKGTVVEAFDRRGVLCGRVIVDRPGQYGLMPVYGDYPFSYEDEGPLPGEVIELRVNSKPAITSPPQVVWSSAGDLLRVEIYAYSGDPPLNSDK